jgi:hypothetical protein
MTIFCCIYNINATRQTQEGEEGEVKLFVYNTTLSPFHLLPCHKFFIDFEMSCGEWRDGPEEALYPRRETAIYICPTSGGITDFV